MEDTLVVQHHRRPFLGCPEWRHMPPTLQVGGCMQAFLLLCTYQHLRDGALLRQPRMRRSSSAAAAGAGKSLSR